MIKHHSVSVILPSYNEKDSIREAITRIQAALGRDLLEIIVVDDDSPDGTWRVVEQMNNPVTRLIRRKGARSLAAAIAHGIRKAKGDIITWLDCDLGVSPEIIPKLIGGTGKFDVVVGSRYVSGGRDGRHQLRALSSFLMNRFAMVLLGNTIRDYTSGIIAVKKSVTDTIPLCTRGFGEYCIEFLFLCQKQGYAIAEVGVQYVKRTRGVSKSDGDLLTFCIHAIRYGIKVVQLAWKNV